MLRIVVVWFEIVWLICLKAKNNRCLIIFESNKGLGCDADKFIENNVLNRGDKLLKTEYDGTMTLN